MNDSYYHHTYELQKRLGVIYDFNILPEREILRLQRSHWYGENYSSRIWNNTQALADSLKNELLIGLMTGRSTRDIAEIISQRFAVGKNASRRLVRTESAYYHGQMELKSYDEADISHYQFVSTLDLRTSTICREHDQMVYKTKEAIVGVNYPPMHPWCRSTTIAYFDDKWAKGKKRRTKDAKTGKNILVPDDMTYDDWYAKHVKPLYKVDGLKQSDIDRANQQYIKYKDILGDERTPKTLADFVDLKYNNAEEYKGLKHDARVVNYFNGDIRESLSDLQKKQAVEAYFNFKKTGIVFGDHAIARYIERMRRKNGTFVYNYETVRTAFSLPPNYVSEQNGRLARYYNGILYITEPDTGIVVTMMKTRRMKGFAPYEV